VYISVKEFLGYQRIHEAGNLREFVTYTKSYNIWELA